MALRAKTVLADCEIAYTLLMREEKDSPTWKVHWVACLALLRTVGSVLEKVDKKADEKHKQVITNKWNEWNSEKAAHPIFWNFIKAERDNLVKEYRFGVEPEPNYLVTEDGDRIVTDQGDAIATEDDYFRLSHVEFENREGRNVIREAINWWQKQLEGIEAHL